MAGYRRWWWRPIIRQGVYDDRDGGEAGRVGIRVGERAELAAGGGGGRGGLNGREGNMLLRASSETGNLCQRLYRSFPRSVHAAGQPPSTPRPSFSPPLPRTLLPQIRPNAHCLHWLHRPGCTLPIPHRKFFQLKTRLVPVRRPLGRCSTCPPPSRPLLFTSWPPHPTPPPVC